MAIKQKSKLHQGVKNDLNSTIDSKAGTRVIYNVNLNKGENIQKVLVKL